MAGTYFAFCRSSLWTAGSSRFGSESGSQEQSPKIGDHALCLPGVHIALSNRCTTDRRHAWMLPLEERSWKWCVIPSRVALCDDLWDRWKAYRRHHIIWFRFQTKYNPAFTLHLSTKLSLELSLISAPLSRSLSLSNIHPVIALKRRIMTQLRRCATRSLKCIGRYYTAAYRSNGVLQQLPVRQ